MFVALIPARGGSKGIKRKNIKEFCGLPLIAWTIKSALNSKKIDRVIVSTEDEEIAQIAKKFGAEVPFKRPNELCGDKVPNVANVLHLLEEVKKAEDVLLLQPTSPLRETRDIDGIINFRNENKAESAFSLTLCENHPSWMSTIDENHKAIPIVPKEEATCRQDLSKVYILNGALYLGTREFFLREKSLFNKDSLGFIMPKSRSIDIDTLDDWKWAEILKERFKKANS